MNDTNVAVNAGNGKRIVVLDIETISTDPNDPRGALGLGVKDGAAPGEKSQIVLMSMLIDDGYQLTAAPKIDRDERRILEAFWSTVDPTDTLVGFDIRDFDIPRIHQRSWILGVQPTVKWNLAKYRETNVVDVAELWNNWSPRTSGLTLDGLARALRLPGGKNGSGALVQEWWRNGEYTTLMDYGMNDVYLTYLVYCRMMYREPLPFALPEPEPASSLESQLRESIAHVEARPAPVRDPNARLRPLSELRPQREPATAKAAARRPVAVAERPGPISASGRYRYVNDGNGGMRQLPVEPPMSSAEGGAEMMTPSSRASATPSVETNHKRSSRKRVYFVDAGGGMLTLTGATFPIKEELKAIGARMVWDEAAHKLLHWSIEAGKFDRLAGVCARAGIALAAGRENAA